MEFLELVEGIREDADRAGAVLRGVAPVSLAALPSQYTPAPSPDAREQPWKLLQTYRLAEASEATLYQDEGYGAARGRSLTAQRTEQALLYRRRLGMAVDLLAEAYQGSRRARLILQEAMSTSDFPQLFGDIIDRLLLANYQEAPYTWSMVARRRTVADFRTVKRFVLNGAEGVLPVVEENVEYTSGSVSDDEYSYKVAKYGRKLPFTWESIINDDLQAFDDIPERMGRSARRTEEKFCTQLYVDASGPHASFFTVGHKNIINTTNGADATNPALSIAGLRDAFTVLSKMVDSDGEPIAIEGMVLVVPPALEIVAYNMLNATELWLNAAGGASSQQVHVANWARNRVKLAVNYYLPIVASSAHGDTSWFVFADPNMGRPALEMGFLRGHETPEVFVKAPNAMRVGGGAANAMDGDFDTDGVQYKIRHVLGGAQEDPKCAVSSNGSGS